MPNLQQSSRYRSSFGLRDEPDTLAGDAAFVGVNMIDSPETLQAGEVREAVNHDFTRSSGDPRGGFVCVPQLAASPVGTSYAEASYVDPTSRKKWQVFLTAAGIQFFRQGSALRTIALPAAYALTEEICTMLQAQNKFFVFQRGNTPLIWNGDWNAAATAVVRVAYDVYLQIPNAFTGVFFQDRLWLPYDKDSFADSTLSDILYYDGTQGTYSVNKGAGDELLTVVPFGRQIMVVFKTGSISKLLGVTSSLTNLSKDEVTRSHGLIAQRAVVQAGDKLYYLSSDRAVRALDLSLELDIEPVAQPVSAKIRPWMNRINWQFAWRAVLHHDEERLFLAVPMDGSQTNNKILVYNLVRQQWDGLWEFDAGLALNFRGFSRLDIYGQLRLCALTQDGRAYMMDEGYQDIIGSTVYPIATRFVSRGYMPNPRWSRGALAEIQLTTWSPNFTVTVETDGVGEITTLAANQTYDRTQSHYFAVAQDWRNLNGQHDNPGAQDYSFIAEDAPGGVLLDNTAGADGDMQQAHKISRAMRTQGRWHSFTITNADGVAAVRQIGLLAREADRAGRRPI